MKEQQYTIEEYEADRETKYNHEKDPLILASVGIPVVMIGTTLLMIAIDPITRLQAIQIGFIMIGLGISLVVGSFSIYKKNKKSLQYQKAKGRLQHKTIRELEKELNE